MPTARATAAAGLTAASALLAVTAAAVWVATLFVTIRLEYATIDRSAEPSERATITEVSAVPHGVQFGLTGYRFDRRQSSLVTLATYIPTGLSWQTAAPAGVGDPARLLPAVSRPKPVDTGFGTRSTVLLAVPLWLPVVAFSLLPVVRVRRWWKGRRRVGTACRGCGYDLRHSPDRCPECGRDTPALA